MHFIHPWCVSAWHHLVPQHVNFFFLLFTSFYFDDFQIHQSHWHKMCLPESACFLWHKHHGDKIDGRTAHICMSVHVWIHACMIQKKRKQTHQLSFILSAYSWSVRAGMQTLLFINGSMPLRVNTNYTNLFARLFSVNTLQGENGNQWKNHLSRPFTLSNRQDIFWSAAQPASQEEMSAVE